MGHYFDQLNSGYEERYQESIKKVEALLVGKHPAKYEDYLKKAATFIMKAVHLEKTVDGAYLAQNSFEALHQENRDLFMEVTQLGYGDSYANPKRACELFGLVKGQYLAYVYTQVRNLVGPAYEHQRFALTHIMELFLQVAQVIEKEDEALHKVLSDACLNGLDVTTKARILRKYDPDFDTYSSLLMEKDHRDLRYLFGYGAFITETMIKTAEYLNTLTDEKIDKMADITVDAFVRGYELGNKEMPLSDKGSIVLGYPIGFERLMKRVAEKFLAMKLRPIVYTDVFTAARSWSILAKPSEQYSYDHRFDEAIYFSKEYTKAAEEAFELATKMYGEVIRKVAGPVVQESFGETPFTPEAKSENLKLNHDQTELKNAHNAALTKSLYRYLPSSNYSFVIVAYPTPDIGKDFEAIFEETIKVNTMDNELYSRIHQAIIDVMDQGDYVHLVGMAPNKTNMFVKLYELQNPEKETIFENCLADVNVPVGEVFTSPVLKGTHGTIYVSEVFLDGLKYKHFQMRFEDGMIKDYTCSNFEDEEENQKFIFENLLHPNRTLPIGEFAIGTNTAAYTMAKKYGIGDLLPILISEKMGPHFAIGDTCYSWREDIPVFNPDGKEIVARDNEKSILRKTDEKEAYTHKHTDITIPFEELALIEVITKDGRHLDILKDGRFVLKGTEPLNEM